MTAADKYEEMARELCEAQMYPTTLGERAAIAAKLREVADEAVRAERAATRARLEEWTHQHGAALVPSGCADTFGEGMRKAKEQIRALLKGGDRG